ncbi:MAG: hypothetical protein HY951_04185 [Bacteroidia bacterium]|nr:hypothetical protein [Bacteroidia bacterium]
MALICGIYSNNIDKLTDEKQRFLTSVSIGNSSIIHKINKNGLFVLVNPLWNTIENCFAEFKNYSCIISGRITNINELKDLPNQPLTDSHALIVLSLYLNKGDEFATLIKGQFSILIYNEQENTLFITNDKFGIWPMFIKKREIGLFFSTEYELLVENIFDLSPDYKGISEYFFLGSPLNGKTFFKNISKIKPCSVINCNKDKISETNYTINWPEINFKRNIKETSSQLAEIFNKAVNTRLKIEQPKQCMLTGGLDSRFILSCIPDDIRKTIEFITFTSPRVNETLDRDIIISKMIANKKQLNHKVINYQPWSSLWETELSPEHLKVWRDIPQTYTIGGFYGGELISGGCFEMMPKEIFLIDKNKFNIYSKFKSIKSRKIRKLLPIEISKYSNEIFDELKFNYNKLSMQNKLFWFALTYITGGFFTSIYGGINSRWHTPYLLQLKSDSPFLDTDFLTFLMTIPPAILQDVNMPLYNSIYSEIYPELSSFPTNSKFGLISGNCILYLKEGVEPRDSRTIERKINIEEFNNISNKWLNCQNFEKPNTGTIEEQYFVDFITLCKYLKLDK